MSLETHTGSTRLLMRSHMVVVMRFFCSHLLPCASVITLLSHTTSAKVTPARTYLDVAALMHGLGCCEAAKGG